MGLKSVFHSIVRNSYPTISSVGISLFSSANKCTQTHILKMIYKMISFRQISLSLKFDSIFAVCQKLVKVFQRMMYLFKIYAMLNTKRYKTAFSK